MKLKRLLLICAAASILTGCVGEGAMVTMNYYFVNATDKAIDMEAYYENEDGSIKVEYSFTIPVGGETLISGKHFPENHYFFPFSQCNRIRISNEEKTIVQVYNYTNFVDERDPLFLLESYEQYPCSKKGECYRYVFTESDFEEGIPVDK